MKELLKELYAKKDCTTLVDVLEIAIYGYMDDATRERLRRELVARGVIEDDS